MIYIYKTEEVQVEDEESRVFGSSNWAREHKDERGKGERCSRLANT